MRKLWFSTLVVAAFLLAACGDSGNNVTASNTGLDGMTPTSSVSEPYSSDGDSEPESFGSEPESSGNIYNVSIGTLNDLRDGQTYRTTAIEIFDDYRGLHYSEEWMAENLNYATDNSYCYDDALDKCAAYGRLYTWAAAVGKSQEECGGGQDCGLPLENIRGICPQGWHLPSRAEWASLIVAVDGSITEYISNSMTGYTTSNKAGPKLKSASGWNGRATDATDAYSFSALPAGNMSCDYGYCLSSNEGTHAVFWSSTAYNSDFAYNMALQVNDDDALLYFFSKNIAYSVRCIKDK